MLVQRFPQLSEEQIVVIAGIPRDEIRQEGEAKGRQDEAASMTLRLLTRRCGPLTDATTAQIQALPLQQLEALAVGAAFSAGVALLDFTGPADPADLAAWLGANT